MERDHKYKKYPLVQQHLKLLLLILLISKASLAPPLVKPYQLSTVVIDAGHGGHDTGCLGDQGKEKIISLAIALKLGKLIEANFEQVKVVYTRKKDEFIALDERANIANNAKADLFICIHCNSACYRDAKKKKDVCNAEIQGTETWIMGLHKSEANLEVAKRENEVVLLEKDYAAKYDGYDPNSPEANIIFSLYQNTFMEKSIHFASLVQAEVVAAGRKNRGVKQAGFLVLYKTYMPGALIETGFLSNKTDEKFLMTESGQDKIAKAIYTAFKKYKLSIEQTLPQPKSENLPNEDVHDNASLANDDPALSTNNSNREIYFSVQFLSSPTPLKAGSTKFKNIKNYQQEKIQGAYKYTKGHYSTFAEALKYQHQLSKAGFSDAFVVAYEGPVRIPTLEARKKTER